jgi:hypothetical protein
MEQGTVRHSDAVKTAMLTRAVMYGATNLRVAFSELVDQLLLRCCYGLKSDNGEACQWSVCAELETDSRNLRLKVRKRFGAGHSHAAHALVAVRVEVDADRKLLTSVNVMAVDVRGASAAEKPDLVTAPDFDGLCAAIQRWAEDEYEDKDGTDLHQDIGVVD